VNRKIANYHLKALNRKYFLIIFLIENSKIKMQNYNAKFKIKYAYLFLIIFFQFLIITKVTHADSSLVGSLGCATDGKCELNDFLKIAFWVWKWILSISGSLALLFFIYGGFTFLISGGSSERVTKGKTILINSIIGLVIIFTSFLIVNFILVKLGYNVNTNWFAPPK
jgi:hypothetical protein